MSLTITIFQYSESLLMQIGDPLDGFFHTTFTLKMDSYIATSTDSRPTHDTEHRQPQRDQSKATSPQTDFTITPSRS